MGFTFNEFPWSKYYDSDLREILNYMKEFEAKIDSYDEIIEQLREALLEIGGLYDRVDALESATSDLDTIRSNIVELYNDFNTIDLTVKANYDYLNDRIDNISAIINGFEDRLLALKVYVDQQIEIVKADVESDFTEFEMYVYRLIRGISLDLDELRKLVDDIKTSVINPWREPLGNVSIQDNMYFIYNDLADECLTAEQYCRLGLSATDYSAFDLSARTYTEFGKEKLHFRWVYSPVYGFRQEISNVLTSIINFVRDTLTADEYSALDLDADAYIALDMTALQYYSYMTDEGWLKLGGGGLTAEQYSTITT